MTTGNMAKAKKAIELAWKAREKAVIRPVQLIFEHTKQSSVPELGFATLAVAAHAAQLALAKQDQNEEDEVEGESDGAFLPRRLAVAEFL